MARPKTYIQTGEPSCKFYEPDKKNNWGLQCGILCGSYVDYYSGETRHTVCEGRKCKFYKGKEGNTNENTL